MRVVLMALLGLVGACTGTSDPPMLTLEGHERVQVNALGPVPAPSVHADGTPVSVEWQSSSPSVVTVEDNRIVAVGAGEAHIIGRVDEQQVEWAVVVELPAAVHFEQTPRQLMVGEAVWLQALVDGPDAGIEWRSSDPTIATVSSEGAVMAIAPGVVYITAQAGTAAAMCEIAVVP